MYEDMDDQLALFELPPVPVEEQPCTIYGAARAEIMVPIISRWTEAQFQATVEQVMRMYHLQWHHCRDSRLCHGIGFPDLVILGPGGALWRELKVHGRKLAFEQRRWGNDLLAAGQNWKTWTEHDYASGLISAELASIAAQDGYGQAA